MDEYLPLESSENGDTRNYSEDDVVAISRILTGLWNELYVRPPEIEGGARYYSGTMVYYT
jgi:hypothetical protein